MIGIKYISPEGCNGYAEWGKSNLRILFKSEIPITYYPYRADRTQLNDKFIDNEFINLIKKEIPYNIVVHNTIPPQAEMDKEIGKINVVMTIWETDKLCYDWVKILNKMDAVIVPSFFNKNVFIKSGVCVPIYVVPIPKREFDFSINGKIDLISGDEYIFYSIGQWTRRKGFEELLKSFCLAFKQSDKVALVIKTYEADFSEKAKNTIRRCVLEELKSFNSPPKIILLLDELTKEEMIALHSIGDCYVSFCKGEGWGLGAFDAACYGNPIIMTDFGSQKEFLVNEHTYFIKKQMIPVKDMVMVGWYAEDQKWAMPDIEDGIRLLKEVYNNKNKAKSNGEKLKKYCEKNFSVDVVGRILIDTLSKISSKRRIKL